MLLAEEKATLEESLAAILQHPHSVSQSLFNETYNTVYTHCTALSEEYSIKGSSVYDLLAEGIHTFTSKLEFHGSISPLAKQVEAFRSSLSLMAKIFSYLERFYIKRSILRDLHIKKLKDLFYFKLYYNYIYKVEEGILDLVFLEIETSRKLYRQECSELKTVVTFYLELLVSTGQDGAMRHFFKRYVEDFRQHTDFNAEIGKLLKKVYLEVFFASNVLGDRDVCREIIQGVVFRKDEIIEHVFAKIAGFEKFKHIYKIISMMPEAVRGQFRCRYGEALELSFSKLSTFPEIYGTYVKTREQITANRMSGYREVLDDVVKRVFSEKKHADQTEIQIEMVCAIERFIGSDDPGDVIDADTKPMLAGNGHSKKSAGLDMKGEHGPSIDLDAYFDLFALFFTEYLMDLYTERCQYRLLRGFNPAKEQAYAEMILQRVGWSAATKLKSSVASFTNRYILRTPGVEWGQPGLALDSSFMVSLAKITKGFWDVKRSEVKLHPFLEKVKHSISGLVLLAERQKLDFNYRLSPVVFEVAGNRYKVSSDIFSMYLHILTADNISVGELRSLCDDRHFDANVDFLVIHKLILYDGEFKAARIRPGQGFVDLFVVPQKQIVREETVCTLEKSIHVVESKICSVMKRAKRMQKQALAECIECDKLDFEVAFTGLVSRGFLEMKETEVSYIP